jgi:ubiquitin fusion degradation protein 1
MMQNMLLEVGDMVKLRNVSLPKGTYVKLQPATSDFLDISNPKAVLERTLRSYTCLTVGDTFVVHYNNRAYEIEVKEAKPGNAISVVETDCQVCVSVMRAAKIELIIGSSVCAVVGGGKAG